LIRKLPAPTGCNSADDEFKHQNIRTSVNGATYTYFKCHVRVFGSLGLVFTEVELEVPCPEGFDGVQDIYSMYRDINRRIPGFENLQKIKFFGLNFMKLTPDYAKQVFNIDQNCNNPNNGDCNGINLSCTNPKKNVVL